MGTRPLVLPAASPCEDSCLTESKTCTEKPLGMSCAAFRGGLSSSSLVLLGAVSGGANTVCGHRGPARPGGARSL